MSRYQLLTPQGAANYVKNTIKSFLKPFQKRPVIGSIQAPLDIAYGSVNDRIPIEITQTNPVWVPPYYIELMRNFPAVRLGLVRMRSALKGRKISLKGGSANSRRFHQQWIDKLLPEIDSYVPEAVFYGCFFSAVDWDFDDQGRVYPKRLSSTDPQSTTILTDETNSYAGFTWNGQDMTDSRSVYLGWETFGNHLYGRGAHLTVYPQWYAYCFVETWERRYLESGVNPLTLIYAQKYSINTGALNPDGTPQKISLARMLRDAFANALGGAKITIPKDDEGNNRADIETLDLPDRSAIYQGAKDYLKQSILESLYSLPGTGITSTVGENKAVDAAVAEKTQNSIFQLFADMPIGQINKLIEFSHKASGFEGPAPIAESTTLDPRSKELFSNLTKQAMNEELKDFETGKSYRLLDVVDWSQTLDIVGVPRDEDFEPGFVADPSPGIGGRPKEPTSERGQSRDRGNDR